MCWQKKGESGKLEHFPMISNTPYDWGGHTGEQWLLSGDTILPNQNARGHLISEINWSEAMSKESAQEGELTSKWDIR